ncbi:MAG: hypothetical protein F4Z75_01645, partial [Synechococcus sp. SB0668_bin_15]|nr:hypothetical protein [Synechococcus sp. SB0668_bin_15]
MTSSTPASKPQNQPPALASPSLASAPSTGKPWWRRWSEPIVVATVVIALIMGAAAGFQSIKGDIHASEARVHEEVRT